MLKRQLAYQISKIRIVLRKMGHPKYALLSFEAIDTGSLLQRASIVGLNTQARNFTTCKVYFSFYPNMSYLKFYTIRVLGFPFHIKPSPFLITFAVQLLDGLARTLSSIPLHKYITIELTLGGERQVR